MAATSSFSEVFPRMAMRAALQGRSATPLARSLLAASRTFSTASRQSPLVQSAKTSKPSILSLTQRRTIFGSSWGQNANRNMLAYLEQTANNNPGSATAQNAFYQALLRSNMPEILVERYNTGRFATNQACDNVYGKALERVGAAEGGGFGGMAGRNMGGQGQNHGMSPEQMQAIGQAVSARTNGGNVSLARNASSVSGAKGEPLYVVVDESVRAYVFRWVKFICIFALSLYCALIFITLFIEATGMLKKVSGASGAETKPEQQKTRFADVHGCDEAKEELQEVVDFLKNPDQFSTLGGKLPKGVLLSGPPGTGKTLLARAVAGEAGVPFFYMSGSEFDEMYVGVGAKRVRELFASARGKAPAIIFLDELDAMGGKRNDRDAAYARQTLNQLLTEMDGFDQDTGVIVIGATNFPEALDNALTRPGRFDRNIVVPLPDVRGRIAILEHHLKNIKIGPDVDTSILARGASGFSGADIENLCNQAATHASKRKSTFVTLEDMTWALDKIYMGAERRSAVIQQKDKIMTAYHEAGHALVAMLSPASDPLYKATIMPRGHALGITYRLPEMDQVSRSRRQLMADIDVSMGGKAAEELIYGRDYVTTGASSDIQNATNVARHMVTQAGMSELVGNVDISGNYNKLSMQTRQDVDAEVRRFVEEGRERVVKLLAENRQSLERIALGLVEYETLNKDEMEKLVRGESLGDKLKVNIDANIKLPELVKPRPDTGMPGTLSPGTGKGGGAPA